MTRYEKEVFFLVINISFFSSFRVKFSSNLIKLYQKKKTFELLIFDV